MAETPARWTHGQVFWTELNTWKPEQAVGFLEKTLGWAMTSSPMPDGSTYWVGALNDVPAGGVFTMTKPTFDAAIPDHWITYFAVDDVDDSVAQVQAAGGRIVRPPFDVPDVGRIAMIKDPGGAVCGYMRPADALTP